MDVGVGAVMFATGISARKVREETTCESQMSFWKDLFTTLKNSFIVIIIGFIRFVIIKDLNYQVSFNLAEIVRNT